jgi:hypothetical protein
MQCREFENRLNLLLDERRPPGADTLLAAHAEACEKCGQLLAGHETLLAGLAHGKRLRSRGTSGDFSKRVVAQIAVAEPVRPSRRAWLVAGSLLAAAAAVLVAVSIAAWNSVGGSNLAVKAPLAPQTAEGVLAAHQAAPPNAPRLRPQSGVLSLGGYRNAIADVASTLPDAVERLDQVERYAPGIRPIRISFTMLLEALWRTIPGMGGDASAESSTHWPLRGASGLV